MAKFNKCPTCGMPIEKDEKLIAYYHEPRDWWVMVHTGPGFDTLTLGGMVIPNAKTICHQARYETPILIGQRGSS